MLSANQRRALAAQLSSPNRRAAAKACGLSESVLVKYSQNPEYMAALDAGRDAQLQEAVHSLNACTTAAVATLRQIVDSPKAQDMAKIAAARALLEFALRFTESAGAAAVPAVVIVDDLPELGSTVPPLAEISREGGETDGNEVNGLPAD